MVCVSSLSLPFFPPVDPVPLGLFVLDGLVGLVLLSVLPLPDTFPLLAVSALIGAWYRKGTATAVRLDAMSTMTPMRRLFASKFIVFLSPFSYSGAYDPTGYFIQNVEQSRTVNKADRDCCAIVRFESTTPPRFQSHCPESTREQRL